MKTLKEKYEKEVIPAMKEQFGYKNNMAIPKIEKVVINIGFGKKVAGKTGDERKKIAETIRNDIKIIAGQTPVLTRAKKSISSFKVREGMAVGASVTLRGPKMRDFLERVINIVLPRTRDFQGLNIKSIDKGGNLTFSILEHIAFPEIEPEKVREILSLEITVVTTAQDQERGLALLRLLGFPIKK
ncbi:MAG: 50S ribosomal protein L5 [Patescibacteria group bacterium]